MNLPDPLVVSTDAYVTAICYIGSKSLSHVLSCIERCKERLLALAPTSPAAQKQIIESVMQYWKYQPGIGVNIVDKLLNYTILSPNSVVEWALGETGSRLSDAHVFEMISATIGKVTGRVRQVVRAKMVLGLLPEQRMVLEETAERERKGMRDLFTAMEDLLTAWASGSRDQMMQSTGSTAGELAMVKHWGERWLRVFRRKIAVEESWFVEAGREKVPDGDDGDVPVVAEESGDMKIDADLP
jgi:nuclear cap-binding protein subunit 1